MRSQRADTGDGPAVLIKLKGTLLSDNLALLPFPGVIAVGQVWSVSAEAQHGQGDEGGGGGWNSNAIRVKSEPCCLTDSVRRPHLMATGSVNAAAEGHPGLR